VDDEPGEAAAPPTMPVFRIRWGWFAGCIVLGLAAIAIGWLVSPGLGYLAGVLANVGTTLLLVGIVVLLERRIIDSAVHVVRRANERSNEALRMQIRDLERQVASVWESTTAADVARKKAETARLTDEFTRNVIDEATGER
jgi:hypothetical protein